MSENFTLSRPRSDVFLEIKAYNEDGYIKDLDTPVTHTFGVLRSVSYTIAPNPSIIRTLDGGGDNYGYLKTPPKFTGDIDVLIESPKTALLLRECMDLDAICDMTITAKYPRNDTIKFTGVLFTDNNFEVNSTYTDVPVVKYSFEATGIEISGTKYGDGWEDAPSGAQPDNTVW